MASWERDFRPRSTDDESYPILAHIGESAATVRRWNLLKGLGQSTTPNGNFRELVDNSLAAVVEGERCNVEIFIRQAREGSLIVRDFPTRGLSQEEALRLNVFARTDEELVDSQSFISGQYGFGGMAALALFTSENGGDFSFVSKYRRGGSLLLKRDNWREVIDEPADIYQIPLKTHTDLRTQQEYPATEIRIDGLSERAKKVNAKELADMFGLTYGEMIKKGRLRLVVRHQSQRPRHTEEAVGVVPFEFNFGEKHYYTQGVNLVNARGKKIRGLKIDIEYGLLDTAMQQNHLDKRNDMYGKTNRASETQLPPQPVLVYYDDRHIMTTTCTKLGLPYASNRHSMDAACVIVRLPADGRIKRGPFKDKLVENDEVTEAIWHTLKNRKDVAEFLKKLASDEVSLTKEKGRLLATVREQLAGALTTTFGTAAAIEEEFGFGIHSIGGRRVNLSEDEAADAIGQRLERIPRTEEEEPKQKKKIGKKIVQAARSVTRSKGVIYDMDSNEQIWEVVPPIVIQPLGVDEPAAAFTYATYIDPDDVVEAIALNVDDPMMLKALEVKSAAARSLAIQFIVREVVASFYEEKGASLSNREKRQKVNMIMKNFK